MGRDGEELYPWDPSIPFPRMSYIYFRRRTVEISSCLRQEWKSNFCLAEGKGRILSNLDAKEKEWVLLLRLQGWSTTASFFKERTLSPSPHSYSLEGGKERRSCTFLFKNNVVAHSPLQGWKGSPPLTVRGSGSPSSLEGQKYFPISLQGRRDSPFSLQWWREFPLFLQRWS